MSNNQDGSTPSCAATCWGAGALVGVVLAGVLMFAASWSFFGAVLIGVVAFGLVGGVMSYTLCRELPQIGAAKPVAAPKSSAAPAPAPAEPMSKAEPAPASAKEPAAAKAPEPEAAEPKGTILPGEADLAARKGTWRYAPEADTAEAPAADAGPAGDVPHAIDAPRGGQADDLKLLRGIGPKLEQELNALGYYHFDQIAALTEAQSDALAERLTARGRANRANWIAHAREMVAEHGKAD